MDTVFAILIALLVSSLGILIVSSSEDINGFFGGLIIIVISHFVFLATMRPSLSPKIENYFSCEIIQKIDNGMRYKVITTSDTVKYISYQFEE